MDFAKEFVARIRGSDYRCRIEHWATEDLAVVVILEGPEANTLKPVARCFLREPTDVLPPTGEVPGLWVG
jgi:hypothetical protein